MALSLRNLVIVSAFCFSWLLIGDCIGAGSDEYYSYDTRHSSQKSIERSFLELDKNNENFRTKRSVPIKAEPKPNSSPVNKKQPETSTPASEIPNPAAALPVSKTQSNVNSLKSPGITQNDRDSIPTHRPDDHIDPNGPVVVIGKGQPTVDSTTFHPVLPHAAEPQSEGDDVPKDVDIKQFPDEITNATLAQYNITNEYKDSHIYYNSTFYTDENIGQSHWVDMDYKTNVKVHGMLSQSHRRAAIIKLSFDFPFYGHIVHNVTIATGGFLFTGEHIHTWLAATQYIAPLMANFDTTLSNDSLVKYLDNGTALTVLWENVFLKDTPEYGNFTFEVTLHQSGDIVFVYKNIPVLIEKIRDDNHPVKVGLSDAYIIDRTIFFVKRKTIYEYHRVNFNKEDIRNWTTIYLKALPTCHDMKDCDSCTKVAFFECKWCPSVGRCSTGLDRLRQNWLSQECDKNYLKECNKPPPPPYAHKAAEIRIVNVKTHDEHENNVKLGTSGVISILLLITTLAACCLFILYAYRNPHSTPGQMLIRYRPSQWRWRRGEARYTAATIHM